MFVHLSFSTPGRKLAKARSGDQALCGKNTLLWQIFLPGKEKLWQTLYFACCWLFGPRPAALPLRSGVAVPRQVERFLIFLWDLLQHLWNKSLGVNRSFSGFPNNPDGPSDLEIVEGGFVDVTSFVGSSAFKEKNSFSKQLTGEGGYSICSCDTLRPSRPKIPVFIHTPAHPSPPFPRFIRIFILSIFCQKNRYLFTFNSKRSICDYWILQFFYKN